MTSRNDLRSRVTSGHTVQQIDNLIEQRVFNSTDRIILHDLWVDGMTYEQVADRVPMTVRGLHYRVKRIAPCVTKYLN